MYGQEWEAGTMKIRLRTVDGHYVSVDGDDHTLTKDTVTATVFDDLATDWPWVGASAGGNQAGFRFAW